MPIEPYPCLSEGGTFTDEAYVVVVPVPDGVKVYVIRSRQGAEVICLPDSRIQGPACKREAGLLKDHGAEGVSLHGLDNGCGLDRACLRVGSVEVHVNDFPPVGVERLGSGDRVWELDHLCAVVVVPVPGPVVQDIAVLRGHLNGVHDIVVGDGLSRDVASVVEGYQIQLSVNCIQGRVVLYRGTIEIECLPALP